MHDMREWFGTQGRLVERLPGFTCRAEQLAMSEQVVSAIAGGENLVVEAGTGVGKTFAYLLPALLAGKRIIMSTGTRSLQDQLFKRDLPTLTGVVGRPVRIALLKGRSNYLCAHRLQLAKAQAEERGLSREILRSLLKVESWSFQTKKGDIGELAVLSDQDPVWPWVTSHRDNCLGNDCTLFDQCHVMNARREALAADIVVVNHHLLMADLMLKEHGFGDLLPGADVVIVDEAHQLPDVATQAFGKNLSARQLQELVRDVAHEYALSKVSGLTRAQLELLNTLESNAATASRSLANMGEHIVADRWPDALIDALDDSYRALRQFANELTNVVANRDDCPELRSLRDRATELADRCVLFHDMPSNEADTDGPAAVRWATHNKAGFVLHHAPIDVARPLGKLVTEQGAVWIFTSATLAVGDDLKRFAGRVGLPDARTAQFGSPFDYVRQALLYLPARLDMPSSPQHTSQVVQAALPVIEAAGGRCFMLFTSYRALRSAAEQLRMLWASTAPYPLLVQGEAPRDALLKQFREHGNAVLLGTGSFWEGVDVKGHALCVVVIDKLPFAVPDEPLTQARLQAIERRGGNAFMEESVPQAVMTLRQGVGRLIRDAADFGVVMLCDRRVTTRSYGKLFLDSLPPMPRTAQLNDVVEFLQRHLSATLTEEVV
jgi:ATP-dependent DNA helicase DinG